MQPHRIVLLLALSFSLGACVTAGRSAPSAPYTVERTSSPVPLDSPWAGPVWRHANTLRINHFLPRSVEELPDSGHRPVTECRLLYGSDGVYVHFRVQDRYVRSIATEYRGRVWEDAAVEFFVQPVAGRGYFNFEVNSAGTLLLSYHEAKGYTGPELRKPGAVPWELASTVAIQTSMPGVIEPEIDRPVTWYATYRIPLTLFEAYLGPLGDLAGQTWRANFYKCAETNSHPHFASWAPLKGSVDFHSPEFFAPIQFAR